MRKVAFVVMVWALFGAALAQEGAWTPAQQEVWGREESYWRFLVARDMEDYLTLWDEAFVGWPSYETSPIGKKKLRDNPLGLTRRVIEGYSFEQKSVQLFGETAITFLQVRLKQTMDGKESQEIRRLTHTWRKREGAWRIIGGMSCSVKPDGMC